MSPPPITPRELFAVGVRLLGVWFGYSAVSYFLSFCINRFQNISFGLAHDVPARTWDYLGFFALDAVVAWVFLFRTERIVRLTYGADAGTRTDAEADASPPEKNLGESI